LQDIRKKAKQWQTELINCPIFKKKNEKFSLKTYFMP
jgi:hypothetical protein